MRELLIELERELEIPRRSRGPSFRRLRRGHAVEARVHFHGIEVLGVEREIVEAALLLRCRLGIEDPVPRALARRIVPTRCADTNATHNVSYAFLSKPNVTFEPRIRMGRRIRFGFSIIRSMASRFDLGSARSLKT